MKIITVHSAKGGVGKTTSALSISSLLAELDDRVLLIDLDPQAAATSHLSKDDPNYDWDKTIRQVLLGDVDIRDAILHPFENFDFIPSQLRLQNIEKELADENNPLFILSDLLESIEDEYDFIIFDTVSHGPIYAWYPLMKNFHEKGVHYGPIASFLYSRGIKLAMIPSLIAYFGLKYSIILTLNMVIFSILVGLSVDILLKDKRSEVS
jgi:hypothetical protein